MSDQPELPAGGRLPRRGMPVRLSDRRSPAPVMPEQMTTALAVIQGYQGDLVDRLARLEESTALFSATIRLDANGSWTRNWQVQYRAVAVGNLSTGLVTVTVGGLADGPPGPGPGTHQLGSGKAAVFAMAGNSLTIYGPAGASVDVQVFTSAMPPNYGEITDQLDNGADRVSLYGKGNGAAGDTAVLLDAQGRQQLGLGSLAADNARNVDNATTGKELSVSSGTKAVASLQSVTATGAGTSIGFGVVRRSFAAQIVTAGGPTALSVTIELSLDGVNWFPAVTSTQTTGDLLLVDKPAIFARANLTTLTGGTGVTVRIAAA